MYLYLNTTNRQNTIIALKKDSEVVWLSKEFSPEQAEGLLLAVDEILKDNKVEGKSLFGIIVVTGPGGFSSTRLGVTTANMLGYAWGVKITGVLKDDSKTDEVALEEGVEKLAEVKKWEPVKPEYGREPNITKHENYSPAIAALRR